MIKILKYTITLLVLIYSNTSFSSLYDDYISGNLEISTMLNINPDIIDYVGPLQGLQFYNANDKGYDFKPNLFGGIANNETEFLSFEFQTKNLFDDINMHLAIALRGHSDSMTNTLRGRGLAIGSTLNCSEGIAIEDFTINALGGGDGIPLKGCKNFQFWNNSNYRIDIHASNNNILYYIFKENLLFLQMYYGYPKWSLQLTGGCSSSPYSACLGHIEDIGGQNVIIGTAFRSSSSYDYTISKVYIAKF